MHTGGWDPGAHILEESHLPGRGHSSPGFKSQPCHFLPVRHGDEMIGRADSCGKGGSHAHYHTGMASSPSNAHTSSCQKVLWGSQLLRRTGSVHSWGAMHCEKLSGPL